MRKQLPLILMLTVLVFTGCAKEENAQTTHNSGWYTYRNNEYQYEIQYPDGFDLWPTGPEGERDGKAIRIGLFEYAAPTPVLDIQIRPTKSWEDAPIGAEINDMIVTIDDVDVNGLAGKQVEYRWESSEELLIVELYLDDVLFNFQARSGSDTYDFQDTEWWEIVNTFHFLDE